MESMRAPVVQPDSTDTDLMQPHASMAGLRATRTDTHARRWL